MNMEGTDNVMIVAAEQTTFSGVISGSGTLLYTGDTNTAGLGYLVLSGDNNFTGGVVFGSPTGNESNSGLLNDLTVGNSNALGTGPLVYLGGFLQDDGQNSYTIANPVELDSTAAHTLYASSTGNTLTFTGTFTGPGGLVKTGPGNLVLTGAATYLGATAVNFGTLTLQSGASITYSSSIAVAPASTLTLDNTGTNNVNRIGAGIALTLAGEALNFLGNAAAPSSQTINSIILNAGSSTIDSQSGMGSSAVLNIGSLTRNAGALLSFVAGGSNLGSATNQINITGANNSITPSPTFVTGGFILPFATVTSTTGAIDFASVLSGAGPVSIAPFSAYQSYTLSGGLDSANSLDVVKVTANDPLPLSATVTAVLIVGDGITVGGGGGTLEVLSGAVVAESAGVTGDTISAPLNLTAEGLLASFSSPTSGNAGLNLASTVSVTALTVGGTGSLELSAANAYVGPTTLTSGTLILNNNTALRTPAMSWTSSMARCKPEPAAAVPASTSSTRLRCLTGPRPSPHTTCPVLPPPSAAPMR